MFPLTLQTVAGGCPAAGHLSCAAKKGNRKKAAPGVAPRIRGVTLCCLPRWGNCGTRPDRAHKTCPVMGLTRFPAGVSWGGIRVVGACIDADGPSLGARSRKRAALNVSTGAQCSSTSPHRVDLLGAPQGETAYSI